MQKYRWERATGIEQRSLQLGKTPRADGANDGELDRQVSEPTDYGERPRRDPDAR